MDNIKFHPDCKKSFSNYISMLKNVGYNVQVEIDNAMDNNRNNCCGHCNRRFDRRGKPFNKQ